MRCTLLFLALVAAAPPVLPAQETPSPYAGQERQQIKSLTPDEVQRYLEGDGMGLARVAELNHYPGPRHTIALAEQLHLTANQIETARRLFDRMHQQAVSLGAEIVALEATLDSLFAEQRADRTHVSELVGQIAQLQGRLRFTHLEAHLELKDVLSPDQATAYDRLRGYAATTPDHSHREY